MSGWSIIRSSNGCCAPSSARVAARTGRGHRRGIEHRVVGRGREERRVRAQVRHVREPRLARRRPVVDEVEQAIGEEHRLACASRRTACATACRRPVGRRTCASRRARPRRRRASSRATACGSPSGSVAPRDRSREGRLRSVRSRGSSGADGPGVDARVGVAEERRLVAQLPGDEGDVGVAGVERRAVEHRPVVHQVHAGVERRPARAARRGLGEMAAERDAAGRESIEVRGAHDRVARAAEAVAAPLVDGHEQHVQVGGAAAVTGATLMGPRWNPDPRPRESTCGPRR